jgi:hypothetical protein
MLVDGVSLLDRYTSELFVEKFISMQRRFIVSRTQYSVTLETRPSSDENTLIIDFLTIIYVDIGRSLLFEDFLSMLKRSNECEHIVTSRIITGQ